MRVGDEVLTVGGPFAPQVILYGAQSMVIVQLLYQLFQADGNQQANDDGSQVDEEILPGMHGCMRCVDIEHGLPAVPSETVHRNRRIDQIIEGRTYRPSDLQPPARSGSKMRAIH